MAPPRPPLPPGFVASLLATATAHAHSIALFAKLGIADLLAERPRTTAELAEATGTRPDALERLLGMCTCLHLLYDRAGVFELTEDGRTLVNDEATARGIALYFMGWQDLEAMLRGGTPSADAGLPELHRGRAARHQAFALAQYAAGFKRSETYVDVGSGNAVVLEAIMKASARSEGIYVGREAEIARIKAELKTAGVAHRCEFLTPAATLPAGDAFVVADRLEDLGDDAAVTLLGRCRSGLRPNGRVVLIGPLVRNQFEERLPEAALLDLERLLFTPAGKCRGEAELRALCTRAGLAPKAFIRAETAYVLESTIATS